MPAYGTSIEEARPMELTSRAREGVSATATSREGVPVATLPQSSSPLHANGGGAYTRAGKRRQPTRLMSFNTTSTPRPQHADPAADLEAGGNSDSKHASRSSTVRGSETFFDAQEPGSPRQKAKSVSWSKKTLNSWSKGASRGHEFRKKNPFNMGLGWGGREGDDGGNGDEEMQWRFSRTSESGMSGGKKPRRLLYFRDPMNRLKAYAVLCYSIFILAHLTTTMNKRNNENLYFGREVLLDQICGSHVVNREIQSKEDVYSFLQNHLHERIYGNRSIIDNEQNAILGAIRISTIRSLPFGENTKDANATWWERYENNSMVSENSKAKPNQASIAHNGVCQGGPLPKFVKTQVSCFYRDVIRGQTESITPYGGSNSDFFKFKTTYISGQESGEKVSSAMYSNGNIVGTSWPAPGFYFLLPPPNILPTTPPTRAVNLSNLSIPTLAPTAAPTSAPTTADLFDEMSASEEARIKLQEMRDNGFIDGETRVVWADINVYNGNMGTVYSLRFQATFPTSGGVFTRCSGYSILMSVMLNPWTWARIMECCMLGVYIVVNARYTHKQLRQYLKLEEVYDDDNDQIMPVDMGSDDLEQERVFQQFWAYYQMPLKDFAFLNAKDRKRCHEGFTYVLRKMAPEKRGKLYEIWADNIHEWTAFTQFSETEQNYIMEMSADKMKNFISSQYNHWQDPPAKLIERFHKSGDNRLRMRRSLRDLINTREREADKAMLAERRKAFSTLTPAGMSMFLSMPEETQDLIFELRERFYRLRQENVRWCEAFYIVPEKERVRFFSVMNRKEKLLYCAIIAVRAKDLVKGEVEGELLLKRFFEHKNPKLQWTKAICRFVTAAGRASKIVGGMSSREQRLFLTIIHIPKQKRDLRDGYSDMTLGQAALAESPRLITSALFWFSILHFINVVCYAVMLYDLNKAKSYQPSADVNNEEYIDLRTPGYFLYQESFLDAVTLMFFFVEGTKFLRYRTPKTAPYSHRIFNLAVNSLFIAVGWMYLAAAHMVAFGFSQYKFRDFGASVDATVITNIFSVNSNFNSAYGDFNQYRWVMLTFYVLFLLVVIFHFGATVYDWMLEAFQKFGSSLERYIDQAQHTTLNEIEKGMVQPLQEVLTQVQSKMEMRLDKQGAHFLKKENEGQLITR